MMGPHQVNLAAVIMIDKLDPQEFIDEDRGEPVEALEEIVVFKDNPTRTVKIGSSLKGDLRTNLINFLTEYRNVFT